MFHSVRWGGWAFDVDGYTPGPPSPPTPPQPPPPGPGWGQLVDCTSCLPHDEPIKQIGKGGTLAACQAACEADSSCAVTLFIIVAHFIHVCSGFCPVSARVSVRVSVCCACITRRLSKCESNRLTCGAFFVGGMLRGRTLFRLRHRHQLCGGLGSKLLPVLGVFQAELCEE